MSSVQPPPVPPPPGAPSQGWGSTPPRKPFWKRPGGIILIVIGAFIVIGIIGAALGAGDEDDDAGGNGNRRRDRGTDATSETPENDPTMSLTEFNAIETGMTLAQVEEIVGSPGELISENDIAGILTQLYMWEGEGLGDNANVTIQNGAVVAKAQFGLG